MRTDGYINKNLSKGLYADYKPVISVDGEGFRCSLYVSGCLFACKGCFNKSIQNFGAGKPYTSELEDKIIEDLRPAHIQGLTLLGGEPMLNPDVCLSIARRLREEYGDTKDIWCWTGYTWEELQSSIECDTLGSRKQKELLSLVDVLVDGRYIDEEKDTKGQIKFRGSWNQRIIDVKETIRTGELVELTQYYN